MGSRKKGMIRMEASFDPWEGGDKRPPEVQVAGIKKNKERLFRL